MPISSAEFVDLLEDYGALLRFAENEDDGIAASETIRAGVQTVFDTNSQEDLIRFANGIAAQKVSSAEAMQSQIYERLLKVLGHPTFVLAQTSLGDSPSTTQLLETFFDLMLTHGKTIQQNVVTVGAVTMDCANADCGKLVLDKKLDGVNVPMKDGIASSRLWNLDSELSIPDDFIAECIKSDPRAGVTFRIRGTKSPSGKKSLYGYTGYGDAIEITPIDYQSILQNGRFETFTSDVPNNWTLNTGVAGTHTDEESGAGNIWLGSKSLKLVGAAALAAINLSQDHTANQIKAGQRYALGAWVKGNTALTQGNLKIRLTWDGASLAAGEFIDLPNTTLDNATTYALYTAEVTIPLNLPTGLKFEIVYDNTPSAHPIYISDIAFGPVSYFNGINAFLKDGKGRFSIGDTAAFTLGNDHGGKFQTYNRNYFRFQWPSSATPNVADSLIS